MSGNGPVGAAEMRVDTPILSPREPGTAAPPPPEPTFFEGLTASFRVARDDIPGHRQEVIDTAYVPLIRELKARGFTDRDIVYGGGNNAYSPDKVWAGVVKARQQDPNAFPGLPRTKEEFDKSWQSKEASRQQKDADVASRSGWTPWLLGTLGGGMTDPINIATMPLGGGVGGTGARAVGGFLIKEFLIGAGTEAVEQPLINQERELQGRPKLTAGERVAGVVLGGLMGGSIAGVQLGAKFAARKAIEAVPLDYRLAQQLKREIPNAIRTPQQQAAINVIERGAEIDATMPGRFSYEGLDAHQARLQGTMDVLDSLPAGPQARVVGADMPAPQQARPAPAPTPAPAPAPRAPARGQVGYSDQIYRGLIARGLPEHTARGVAAGIHAESRSDPNVRGGYKGRALGIGQWLGPRKEKLIAKYGPNPTLDQQLDYLVWELNGGDPGGRSVLNAKDEVSVLSYYIGETRPDGTGWGFMRPQHGSQRKGDMTRGMAALGRGGEDMPGEAGDVAAAPELMPWPDRPAALDAEPVPVKLDNQRLQIASFRPDEIAVDAELMQFKSGGDQFGVTDRLRGVSAWDPMSAGMVTVWEALDGRRLIADGHQRLGLAKRMQAQDPALEIRLPAYILREADGVTAGQARLLTALKNLREGSGTAIDAGKVLREAGLNEDLLRTLPQRGREAAVVRDGRSLASLSPEAFGAVVNKVIPESHGAAIGALAPDPATHMGMVELLAELEPANRHQAESVVRQALEAGFVGERQEELFGTRELTASLFMERAKVLDRTLGELRKLRGAFGVAARNAEALDAAGNKIDVGASQAAAGANARALAIVDRLALRKGNAVNAIISKGAERLQAGEPLARVVRDIVAELRGVDLDRAISETGSAGDAAGRGGYDGDAAGQDGLSRIDEDPDPAELTPAERDALEAEGQGGFVFADQASHQAFDDPAGPGVAKAADSTWHDIRAETAAAADDSEARLLADAAAVHARAQVNQVGLVELGHSLEGEGIAFKDPGPKSPERIAEKVRLEGYGSAAELKDTARAALVIESDAAADQLVAAIMARFPGAFDKGWIQLPTGYLDRKVIVRFADGLQGELQIVPAPVWQAKKAKGGDLYDQERVSMDPAVRARLRAEAQALYAAALAGSPFEGIAARSASGNRSANAAGSSSSPSSADFMNSPGASRQDPLDQAQARPGLAEASTATGRSSTSNSSSFTEIPPLGDVARLSDLLGESQGANLTIDLGDGKGARTVIEIDADLEAELAGIKAIEDCL